MTVKLHELHDKLETLEALTLEIARLVKDEPFLDSREGIRIDLGMTLKSIELMRSTVIRMAFDAGQISF